MKFSNGFYDFLKQLVQIGLPAVATLYFTLAQIWGLPSAEEVVGTISAFTVFLGVVLKISTRSYLDSDRQYDGNFEVTSYLDDDELPVKKYTLNFNDEQDLAKLNEKDTILLKVRDLRS